MGKALSEVKKGTKEFSGEKKDKKIDLILHLEDPKKRIKVSLVCCFCRDYYSNARYP
ncbi:MAG: hypothetical protein ABH844_06985 [Candidatus Omnitrophota bacterium]